MKKEFRIKNLLNEIARDSLAVGSIPMFVIVTARASIGNYYTFVYEILLAGLILFIFSLFIKSQNHLARGIVLFIFTSLFYNDRIFTIFAFFLLLLVLLSLFYLKYNKREIVYGIILGLVSSGISYFLLIKIF